ncbi:MAG: pyridoxal phosphate-dependent aminotransferase family protein [Candidatus Berkelbacteria bacterium]
MNKNTYNTDLLSTVVNQMREHGQYPTFYEVERIFGRGELCVVDGKECIHMGSNGYLGLQFDPEVIAAAHDALNQYGLGSTGSRITAGTTKAHLELEATLAQFEGTEACVVFSTGYLGNMGMIQGLGSHTMKGMLDFIAPDESQRLFEGGKKTHFIFDKLIHRSMIAGIEATMSGLTGPRPKISSFQNGDYGHLETILAESNCPGKVVFVDSIFSLHGRVTDLRQVTEIAEKYQADVYVDEAHATGIYGPQGRGIANMQSVEDKIRFRYGTLSKAIGAEGGFFAGTKTECDAFRVTAPWIFNTSMAPCVAAGARKGIEIVMRDPSRRQKLLRKADDFRAKVEAIGYDVLGSRTHIVPVRFYTKKAAQEATSFLHKHGIFAPCYWYPAVGRTEAMVRMNIMAVHSDEQLEDVLYILKQLKPLSDRGREESETTESHE